jgi:hypothetical protein
MGFRDPPALKNVTNDAIVTNNVHFEHGCLKFNVAAAKLKVAFTSAPEARLTPFQSE